MADRNLQASDIVRLNIGGKERVSVARSTLTLYEDSMLGAMFSGRHKVCSLCTIVESGRSVAFCAVFPSEFTVFVVPSP